MLKKSLKIFLLSFLIAFTSLFSFENVDKIVYSQSEKSISSYIYTPNTNTAIEYVNNTNNVLDTILPSYFDLNTDGSLKLTEALDEKFIDEMHKRNIRVVPFLSNHWDREKGREALKNKESLAYQIKDAVTKYDLDGVNVDLENLTEKDRDDYVEFVRILREILPKEKEVSVAVAANPNAYVNGWQGSYDYEKLAEYSDYIIIMAYDESYQGSNPGPVASINFVENSVKYALEHTTPDKIVLAVPFYGRYWKSSEGAGKGGYGISTKNIEKNVQKYNGKVEYNDEYKSVKATINVNGETQTYWYENEDSLKEKLSLLNKYNLRGASSWSLGQENKNIWKEYMTWIDSSAFKDVGNHWAKEDIKLAKERNLMTGVSNEYFYPDRGLTRAEAATILVRALKLEKEDLKYASFSDIDNHWAKEDIEIAKHHNLIRGITEDKFEPDKIITREEMATILDRVIKKEMIYTKYSNNFYDVSKDMWSYVAIMNMSEEGIFKGIESNMFYPKNSVTRAQMASIINRVYDNHLK